MIVSDRRRRITIKKDVLQTASVSNRMFVHGLNKFSSASGGTDQQVEIVLFQSCLAEAPHFDLSINDNSQVLRCLAEICSMSGGKEVIPKGTNNE